MALVLQEAPQSTFRSSNDRDLRLPVGDNRDLADDAEAEEKHHDSAKSGHSDPDPRTEVENPGTVSLARELAPDVTKRQQPSDGECDCER